MRYFDNTRVSTYKSCPRKFFLRHRLHWTPDRTAAALTFGSSWHAAMDVVWGLIKEKNNKDLHTLAMLAFEECWIEDDMPAWKDMTLDMQDRLTPRTPGTAAEMLMNYIITRRTFLESVDVLSIEQPFAVPLDSDQPDLLYIGRLDKVFQLENRIYVGEHKTTSLYSKGDGIQPRYVASYSPNAQIDGYSHALHMLYGDRAKAVWVDAALVHKTHHDVFKFIPIERQFAALDAWIVETNNWIRRIDKDDMDFAILDASKNEDIMHTFPKNEGACADWAGCTYRDLCKFWTNPHERNCPDGFKVEKWEPFSVLNIDKLGLEDENNG